jgi:hypothetical protein
VEMTNIQGYKQFRDALKVISGEEPSPDPNSKQDKQDQIDSSVMNNTLAKIDPLFSMALNEKSIQDIKDNDMLIKQI